jgi:hypothetical protein
MDPSVPHSIPDPAEPFETWLLRRVAEAVEGGEVSADLLAEIHTEMAETRGRSPDERHALALMELAERVLRRFVEAWLVHQREAYEADHRRGDDG